MNNTWRNNDYILRDYIFIKTEGKNDKKNNKKH